MHMKTIKKSLSLLLALMMLLSLGSFTAIAEDGDGQTTETEVVSSANDLPDIGGVTVHNNENYGFQVTDSQNIETNPVVIPNSYATITAGQVTIKADIDSGNGGSGLTVNDSTGNIVIDAGKNDIFIEANNALHEALDKQGIPHDYTVRPGRHSWSFWVNALDYQMLFFYKALTQV